MQGKWFSANVNLVNSGPLLSKDKSGDLNVNYTLIPSPERGFNDTLAYENNLSRLNKSQMIPQPVTPIAPKLEINMPKLELKAPKIEPLITSKLNLDSFKLNFF